MNRSGVYTFRTSINTTILIRSVEVKPKDKALIKLIYCDGFHIVEKHNLIMEGDDYLAWGHDDNHLGEFVCRQLTGGVATIVPEETDALAH